MIQHLLEISIVVKDLSGDFSPRDKLSFGGLELILPGNMVRVPVNPESGECVTTNEIIRVECRSRASDASGTISQRKPHRI